MHVCVDCVCVHDMTLELGVGHQKRVRAVWTIPTKKTNVQRKLLLVSR